MGRRSGDVYDEQRVAAISSEIAAAIDAATFGGGRWDAVPAAMSKAFPGSWSALFNMNFSENQMNFLTIQNMEPTFLESFAEHFAFINPWATYWMSLNRTTIAASEDVFPARSFAKSEYYNDWLLPQDTEAAVGMKAVGDRGEAVHFLLHFPLSKEDAYDKAGLEILRRVRGGIERSVNLARLLRNDAETAVAEAALVERSRYAAFVTDGRRRIREANHSAEALFQSGGVVSVRNGRCFLGDKDADARFGAALAAISKGLPVDEPSIPFTTANGAWEVVMAALPVASAAHSGLLSLLPPERMILVLITDLRARNDGAGDFSNLSRLFGLAPAEILLCKRLFLGESVADAADRLGVTVETARTRLKAILQKTGTSRQSQLILLLSRLR
jgi:DNA-binding CsgD family transcriptional regulator/PAS domain-containing protein